MNPDTIGYVWTGEFDLNTLRVDGESFESEKKKLRIQKYPDTCGRGLKCNNSAKTRLCKFPHTFFTGLLSVNHADAIKRK